MTALIRWEAGRDGGFTGHAGTPGLAVFRLWPPDDASLGAVFPAAPGEPLTADGTGCDSDVPGCTDGEPGCEEELVQCPDPSRFTVERTDRDPSYHAAPDRAATEACEAHLAETVVALMDGDAAMTATVQVRWDS